MLIALALAAIGAVWGWRRPREKRETRPLVSATARGSDARPNVVLISLDTLRPDHLGCYGYPKPTSPNLDRFAATAARFTNVHSQAPWTLPSHMSLLTSMLPSQNNVFSFNSLLPDEVPTLPQLLKEQGYHTAGLVNNGQMQAQWGFDRGFDLWKEFEVLKPEGSCASITSEALGWLATRPREPFFLFLHYYDAHHPYGLFLPERFRQAFGATLSPEETERTIMEYRAPDMPPPSPQVMDDVIKVYDASIAWLDEEVGKVLAALPPETIVVIFSDHGEGFREHGWTFHGATLYEEETRVVLMVREPASRRGAAGGPGGSAIDEPAMLMDVAPTILGAAGAAPPRGFQGSDLAGVLRGESLGPRLIASETKAFLEGQLLNSLVLYPLKLIYTLHDGGYQLYKLPDEHARLTGGDRAAAEALLEPMRKWLAESEYWMVYAKGEGQFQARLYVDEGQIIAIPFNFDFQHGDTVEFSHAMNEVRWTAYNPKETKGLYLTLAPADVPLNVDCGIDGQRRPDRVFVGPRGAHPPQLPLSVDLRDAVSPPVITEPFRPASDGFYVLRHRGPEARRAPGGALRAPDPKTLEQLRSLGYLR